MRKTLSLLCLVFLVTTFALVAPGCDRLAVIPVGALATPGAPSASAGTGSPAATEPPATPQPSGNAAVEPSQPPEPAATATEPPQPQPTSAPSAEASASPEPSAAPGVESGKMDLLFAGGVMFHSSTLKLQSNAGQGDYDFSSLFENIAPVVRKADFAIADLEAPVSDPNQSVITEERFAAPPEAVVALKQAGFDIVSMANSHAMDQGAQALVHTLDAIRNGGLIPAGAFDSAQEQDRICMLEKNGLKVAFFACTKSVNRPMANDLDAGVDLIDLDRMKQDVQRAHEAGADAVIFSLSFGTQYSHTPDAYQKSVVQALRDAGATAVIGTRPHVLQPFELDSGGKFFAAYSLGDIVTNLPSRDRQFSALLDLTLTKDPSTGLVTVSKVSCVPTWTRALAAPGGGAHVSVFDLRQALTACQSDSNPLISPKYLRELTNGLALARKIIGERYFEATDNP